jgi:hypothetical protein
MTHSWGTLSRPLDHPELYRPSWWERYQSLVAKNMIRLLHSLCPWTDIMDHTNALHYENGGGERANQGLQYSLEQNFGEIEFDWDQQLVQLRSMGTIPQAPPLLMAQVSFDQLSGQVPMSSQVLSLKDFETEWVENPRRYSLYNSSGPLSQVHHDPAAWVCLNHRGRDTATQHVIGYVTSGVILTILVPLPLVFPSILLAMLLLIVIRRWSSSYSSLVGRRRETRHVDSSKHIKVKGSSRKTLMWRLGWLTLVPIRKKSMFSVGSTKWKEL